MFCVKQQLFSYILFQMENFNWTVKNFFDILKVNVHLFISYQIWIKNINCFQVVVLFFIIYYLFVKVIRKSTKQFQVYITFKITNYTLYIIACFKIYFINSNTTYLHFFLFRFLTNIISILKSTFQYIYIYICLKKCLISDV